MAKLRNHFTVIAFIFPAFLLFSVLVVYPVFDTFRLSFMEWKGIPWVPPQYVGWSNYKEMFANPAFWHSLKNSGWFILSSFVIQLPLSFVLALIVTSKLKGIRFFKVAFFIPVVLPGSAVGLMWTYILYPNGGVLNTLLGKIGLSSLEGNWLGDPGTVVQSVALVSCWVYAGLNMIIIAAGLVAIPEEIYDSGKIDGAVGWKSLWHITLPMLSETIKIYSILAVIGSFKVFDLIFVMTRGGPNGASEVPAMRLYNETFNYNHFGMGSAIGIFILVSGILITILFNKLFNRADNEVG